MLTTELTINIILAMLCIIIALLYFYVAVDILFGDTSKRDYLYMAVAAGLLLAHFILYSYFLY